MKIIFCANTSWSLYNNRRPQIESTLRQNWQVGCICSKGPFVKNIKEFGVNKIFLLQNYKKNINIASDFSLIFEFLRIYRKWKPEIVHQFSIKPVIYGTIAARLAKVPVIINTIPGLGYVFTDREKKRRILRIIVLLLYRLSGRFCDFMFFQNEDDKRFFVNNKIISKEKTSTIPGSGVNIQYYSQDKINKEIINQTKEELRYKSNQITILMASRMLYDKGIAEFVKCSKSIKKIKPEVRFILAGPLDPGNPAHIPLKIIEKWQEENKIEYLGRRSDIKELIYLSDFVVFPSYYREGTPKFLLEAASMGKPIITTDVPGCRDVVENEENGILVPVKDVESLSNAVIKLINNSELRLKMGEKSRKKAEREFDEKIVVDQTLKVYNRLIKQKL
ncbi:glycosyltransferase family 4 protein [Candidatus Woesearchaeota archaeon]|nr:glycosyltransferase family 4 protein [Candidatus Woesearchaeota archaeon]